METEARLTGTEKQVAWADKIRAGKRATWAALVASYERDAQDRPAVLADPAAVAWLIQERPILEAWLNRNVWEQGGAAWWIDHREVNVAELALAACRSELRVARRASA